MKGKVFIMKKNIKQRIAGVALIIISIIPLILFKDIKDVTYMLFTLPLGLFFICTKNQYWID